MFVCTSKSLPVCIYMWQCDPVIHYRGAFAGICGVELIKPTNAPRALQGTSYSPSPEGHFSKLGYAQTDDEEEEGHLIDCLKESLQNAYLPPC